MPDAQQPDKPDSLPVFITKVIAGEVFSKEWSAEHPDASLMASAIAINLIPGGKKPKSLKKPGADSACCPSCQMTKADFESTGRFGCPSCYETFGRPLQPLLKKMHRGVRHLGKVPSSYLEEPLVLERINLLEDRLSQVITEENYEEAAYLRDDINELKKLVQTPPKSPSSD
jgi:protein-arginine kinase activator protein McsA